MYQQLYAFFIPSSFCLHHFLFHPGIYCWFLQIVYPRYLQKFFVFTGSDPDKFNKSIMQNRKQTVSAPFIKIIINTLPGRVMFRKHTPLTAGFGHIKNSVHYFMYWIFSFPDIVHKTFYNLPLTNRPTGSSGRIGQITWIMSHFLEILVISLINKTFQCDRLIVFNISILKI